MENKTIEEKLKLMYDDTQTYSDVRSNITFKEYLSEEELKKNY